jgi:hypothetical protein
MQYELLNRNFSESRSASAELQQQEQDTAPIGELPAWAAPAILITLFLASVIQVVGSITL